MALRFECSACQSEVVVRFATQGDAVQCPHCETSVEVPADAEEVANQGNQPFSGGTASMSGSLPAAVSRGDTEGDDLLIKNYPGLEFIRKSLSGILAALLGIGILTNTLASFWIAPNSGGLAVVFFLLTNGIAVVAYLVLKSIPELIEIILGLTQDVSAIRKSME